MNSSLLNQRYIPLMKLGKGGMGEVYLAWQTGETGFRREVAIKRIHSQLSEHPQAVQKFLDEARLAASLCHSNVIHIYDVGQEESGFYIVMERVWGVDLRQVGERTTTLGQMIPLESSINIIIQVLEGLRYAHNFTDEGNQISGIVHGDIGPNNILVSYDGVVKLVDFGMARAANHLYQGGHAPAGKLAYMSPEAVFHGAADARSDLFSVGILLYELTLGRRLFRVNSYDSLRQALLEPITPPTQVRANYPRELEHIVMRSLELEPEDRYVSAEEMLDHLEQFAYDYNVRVSRLRLARFLRQTMGAYERPIPEPVDAAQPPTAEPADSVPPDPTPPEVAEDLDADLDVLFHSEQQQDKRDTAEMEAMNTMAEDLAQADQANAMDPDALERHGKIETLEVEVTDVLVEEEIDLHEDDDELPVGEQRLFLDHALDADLDAGLAGEEDEEEDLLLEDPQGPLAEFAEEFDASDATPVISITEQMQDALIELSADELEEDEVDPPPLDIMAGLVQEKNQTQESPQKDAQQRSGQALVDELVSAIVRAPSIDTREMSPVGQDKKPVDSAMGEGPSKAAGASSQPLMPSVVARKEADPTRRKRRKKISRRRKRSGRTKKSQIKNRSGRRNRQRNLRISARGRR